MLSDIEIAQSITPKRITDVAAAAGIDYPSLCDRIVSLSERKADA